MLTEILYLATNEAALSSAFGQMEWGRIRILRSAHSFMRFLMEIEYIRENAKPHSPAIIIRAKSPEWIYLRQV